MYNQLQYTCKGKGHDMPMQAHRRGGDRAPTQSIPGSRWGGGVDGQHYAPVALPWGKTRYRLHRRHYVYVHVFVLPVCTAKEKYF